MNDVLLLKGKFTQKPNTSRPGAPSLPTNAIVDVEHIRCLLNNLIALERYWIDESIISGALITENSKAAGVAIGIPPYSDGHTFYAVDADFAQSVLGVVMSPNY